MEIMLRKRIVEQYGQNGYVYRFITIPDNTPICVGMRLIDSEHFVFTVSEIEFILDDNTLKLWAEPLLVDSFKNAIKEHTDLGWKIG